MYYNLESLIKMGGLAHVDVPLKMTPRIANAVKKALKNGICEARSGQAAGRHPGASVNPLLRARVDPSCQTRPMDGGQR